jgi:lipopolysaccharide biosynthesis glycosyltransferase
VRNALFLTFDDRYWDLARACLNSLRLNYPGYPRLLLAYRGRSRAIVQWLSRFPRSEFIDDALFELPYDQFPDSPVDSHIVYRRYALWGDAFNGFDTLLGLDVDTLVLKPLDSLFLRPDFFAVGDFGPSDDVRVFGRDQSGNAALQHRLREDGLSYPREAGDMLNAGMFVLPRSRRGAAELNRLVQITRRYASWLAYADQSAISLWMQVHRIAPTREFTYNLQARMLGDKSINMTLAQAAVLHFSDIKPGDERFRNWNLVCDHAELLLELYERYRSADETEFSTPNGKT